MLKFLNLIGVSATIFAIYNGMILFTPPIAEKVVIEKKMEVKEQKKIKDPVPVPKSFDWSKLSRMEMIESSDIIIEDHITSILERNKYSCLGKPRDIYVADFSSSVLSYTKGNLKLALWVTAMAQVESSYRLTADPRISTARGYLQVIYKYHAKELAKAGISKDDLSKNPAKSIQAGIIVFNKYLKQEHGNFRLATRRYRGLSVSEAEQNRYYKSILNIYNKLVADLRKYA